MAQCTSKQCFNETATGDSLFCKSCRQDWRDNLKLKGIEEIQVSETEVKQTLYNFQNRLSNCEVN